MSEVIEAPAPATSAAPAPSAPSSAAPSPAPSPTTTVPVTTTTAAPAATAPTPPAAPDPGAWRAEAVRQAFGDPKDTDPDEVKGERAKLEALTNRYTTLGEMAKALREAQVKISAGIKPAKLAPDATPEQVAQWRKDNGIPEKPEDYDLGLDQGVVLSDTDQKLVGDWIAKVHGANADPAVVKAGVKAMVELRDAQAAQFAENDNAHKKAVEDELVGEWGMPDFRRNVDGIKAMLGSADKAVAETVLNARGPDGRALMNNPSVLRWFATHARQTGFVGATTVPQGGDMALSIEQELAGLRKRMGTEEWAKDTKAHQRFMELTEIKTRLDKVARK